MAYLPNTTNYKYISETEPGLSIAINDFVGQIFNSTSDLNYIQGNAALINTSRILHNMNAVAVYIISPESISENGSSTPAEFTVYDTNGNAGSNNITISGLGNVLINGAATTDIALNYGNLTLTNVGGSNWTTSFNGSDSGAGNVVGPASSLTHSVATYADGTGKTLLSTGIVINPSGTLTGGVIIGTVVSGASVTASAFLDAPTTPPTSGTAVGTAGQIIVGTDKFLYICPSTNVWVRISGLSF